MFIASVGTINDSVTEPVIRNAFLEVTSTLEVVVRTAAVLLIGKVGTVRITVAKEALVDALFVVGAFEQRLVTCYGAVRFVTSIKAVVFTVAPKILLNH